MLVRAALAESRGSSFSISIPDKTQTPGGSTTCVPGLIMKRRLVNELRSATVCIFCVCVLVNAAARTDLLIEEAVEDCNQQALRETLFQPSMMSFTG